MTENNLDCKAGFDESALPCLYRNNSDDISLKNEIEASSYESSRLSTAFKKSAFALALNVENFSVSFGLNYLGFLTLTFADNVTNIREASRRFDILRKQVLNVRYKSYIRVIERTKKGRIHFHVLVALGVDIRTDFDFAGIANCDYRSANKSFAR